jgi:hypothetical protein
MQVYEIKTSTVRRDMDLIRHLLFKLEEDQGLDGTRWVHYTPEDLGITHRSVVEVGYHLQLLIDEGFVIGGGLLDSMPMVRKLTWDGHEFLANIKNDDIWKRTKKRLAGLPSVALSVVAQIAEAEIKQKLGLR